MDITVLPSLASGVCVCPVWVMSFVLLLSGRESELFTKSKISVYLDPVVKSLFNIIVAGIGALLHFIVSCQASGDSAFGPNPTWLLVTPNSAPHGPLRIPPVQSSLVFFLVIFCALPVLYFHHDARSADHLRPPPCLLRTSQARGCLHPQTPNQSR